MMNNLKQKLGKSIENRRDELTAMADKIFDLSEVSGEEYQSAELLCSYLEKEGFEVERGTGFPTAFRAEWRNGSGGPVIGILVEYDALEKIGHACGHHLQGPAGIGAAISAARSGAKTMLFDQWLCGRTGDCRSGRTIYDLL